MEVRTNFTKILRRFKKIHMKNEVEKRFFMAKKIGYFSMDELVD